jgi:hypothetical protein
VFAVEGRQILIPPQYNDELQKVITGIVPSQNHKLILSNNIPDHFHLLVGLRPDSSLSDLVRDVKAGSSKFTKEKRWAAGRFTWQEGFGAASHFPLLRLVLPPSRCCGGHGGYLRAPHRGAWRSRRFPVRTEIAAPFAFTR